MEMNGNDFNAPAHSWGTCTQMQGRIAGHMSFVWAGPILTSYEIETVSLRGVRLKPPLEMLDGSFGHENHYLQFTVRIYHYC